jgi:lipase chaperone LimK
MADNDFVALRESARGGRRRALLWSVLGAIAVIAIALIVWRNTASKQVQETHTNLAANRPISLGDSVKNTRLQKSDKSTPSPDALVRNGNVLIAAPRALLHTPALHRTIEDLIGDVLGSGSIRDDPHGFRERLAARARKHFGADLGEHAAAFLNRYVSYLESLDALNLGAAKNDVAALRSLFDARKALRQSFFAAEEYEALFAREDRLDRYTIARMEVETNSKLTADERTQALALAAKEFTPEERAERANSQLQITAQMQTASFDAKSVSDEERFAARKAQFGEAAAERLAELDRSEREWQSRLAQYEQVQRDAKNGSINNEQLAATRDRMFTAQEQLRLEASLALRKR